MSIYATAQIGVLLAFILFIIVWRNNRWGCLTFVIASIAGFVLFSVLQHFYINELLAKESKFVKNTFVVAKSWKYKDEWKLKVTDTYGKLYEIDGDDIGAGDTIQQIIEYKTNYNKDVLISEKFVKIYDNKQKPIIKEIEQEDNPVEQAIMLYMLTN